MKYIDVEEVKRCPKCNEMYDSDYNFCGECGEKLLADIKLLVCDCGKMLDDNDKYCYTCGKGVVIPKKKD